MVRYFFKIFFIFVICSLFEVNVSQATTFTVDISGGGDFLEIQPAVNAATLGDTILVAPGRYAGEIKFFAEKEGISLIGTGGPAAAKVVGDTIGIGIWEATEPVLIENLEIREVGGFGGLYTHASRVIVRNCVLRDNNGPGNCIGVGGGARVMFGSDVTFTDCLIDTAGCGRGGSAAPALVSER